uniref:Titin n=1 Tax=Ditylenchus dipsaci TaxID=166011 RepID=A0A915DB47_9BILA
MSYQSFVSDISHFRPLSFSDISGEAITLHWSPPKDDGGAPITNYVVEKKNPRTGEWEKVGQPIGSSFRVRNLTNGTKYDFRVRAENQYGVSEPLDADNSVMAKNPFDVPGPPGQPEPIHTSDDSITLRWLRPLSDGGAPILEGCLGNISDTKYRVTGLIPHRSYEFRVAAVNTAGQGEYSENSVPIIAASSPSKPVISMGMLAKDLVVLAGEPAKMLVPYAASPRPEIVWTKNGLTVDERDARAQIESNDFLTQLTYPKCRREDSGNYTIRMENDLGSDSIDIHLKVVDQSCRLFWKAPKDDGGAPITNYVVEKYRLGVDVWDKVSSFVRGTDCLVMELVENERYKFRIFAENQYGLSEPCELPDPITAKYQFSVPSKPEKPVVREMDRNWAHVEWDVPASNGGSKILGYNIQYRDSHSHKWITAIKTSFRTLTSKQSATEVKAWPSWSTNPNPRTVDWPELVTLTWSPPVEDGGSKITGYVVEKREIGINVWEMTNDYNVTTPEFTVPNLKEYHDYEFRIIAVNVHGRGVPSLPSAPIKIQETAGSRPMIIVKPEHTDCPYNKRAVFSCEAIGRPTPTARWLKNGREVPDGARYRVETHEGVYKFIIKEVWDIDAGDYTCEVSNVFGVDSATATLNVQAPPVIEKQVPNAVYPAGDMVRIKIFFSGSAPFTHRLTLNGTEISSENPNIRTVDFDDHLLLTIPELHSHEAGRYEYTISNGSGEATTGFWINVTGLPSAPEGPISIVGITEHQATVSWRPPVDDGGSRITNYVLEKRDTQREEWVVVASAVRELSFIASGLFLNTNTSSE